MYGILSTILEACYLPGSHRDFKEDASNMLGKILWSRLKNKGRVICILAKFKIFIPLAVTQRISFFR